MNYNRSLHTADGFLAFWKSRTKWTWSLSSAVALPYLPAPVTGTLNIAMTWVSGGTGAGTWDDGAGGDGGGDSVLVRLGTGPSWTTAIRMILRAVTVGNISSI